MDPDTRKLLEKNLKYSEENNKILKKIYRSIQWGRFFRVLYWLFIIGTAVGAYYLIQPYIAGFREAFGSAYENLRGIGDLLPFGGGENTPVE